jgi:hypothetical protein
MLQTFAEDLLRLVQLTRLAQRVSELREDSTIGVPRGSHEESQLLDFTAQSFWHGIS